MTKSQLAKKIQQVADQPDDANYKYLMKQSVELLEGMLAAAQAAQQQSKRASMPKSQAKSQPKRKSTAKSQPKSQAKSQPKRKSTAKSQAKSQPKRKSTAKSQPKSQAKRKSTAKRQSAPKLSKAIVARARKISAGIQAGRIAQKQGKAKPSDYTAVGLSTRDKYDKFVALYAGVRIVKKGKAKSASITSIYDSITATNKKPYFLTPGYMVKGFTVGGGKKGPGIIRPIPGKGAQSFKSLPDGQQRAILAFLNSTQGQQLRSKGAPKLLSGSPSRYA